MPHGYNFYMCQLNEEGEPIENKKKNLEADFPGLKYSKLEGMDLVGKPKNVYEETYADSDKLRVYVPHTIHNTATTITLTLYFFGPNRAQVFSDFCDYVSNGIIRYSDTARNHWFDFYIKDEIKPSDEMWYAGEPYFKVELKMQNLYGKTFKTQTNG